MVVDKMESNLIKEEWINGIVMISPRPQYNHMEVQDCLRDKLKLLEEEIRVNHLRSSDNMFQILDLITELKDEKRVFVQTHNFPDHDAVASAYGLSKLMMQFGINAHIIYKGEIQRDSLVNMIESLNIDIRRYEAYDIKDEDKIIVVDGCKGNSNVEELIGDEIAVIDHHEVSTPENVRYVDIRSEYGSCSTIIYTYYKQLQINIPKMWLPHLLLD